MCGSLRPRHDAVLRAVAGAQPADRAERLLAALPQQQPLLRRRSPAGLRGRRSCRQMLDDPVALAVEPGFQAVDFDQQDRLGVERKAEVKRRFDGDQNALIHHLQRRGDDAGADDLADRVGGVVDRSRTRRACVRTAFGLRVSRTQTLVTMAKRPLAADDRAGQVEPGRIFGRAADLHDAAVGQHGLDAQHVIDGDAVLERVRPAGVGGHVAADRAGPLARRIGGVVIAGALQLALVSQTLTTPGSTTA